jgi:2-aminoadipate transaminase
MFLTATLPPGLQAMEVFSEGIRQKVAVLPGMPFFVDGGGTDTIRLNFSNADEAKITEGMHRLAGVIAALSCR